MAQDTCTLDDCDRPRKYKLYCRLHYRRWRETGTTDAPGRPRQKDLPCPVDGCQRKRWYGGLCQAHARRKAKYGDPLGVAPPRKILSHEERFWANVNPAGSDECWPWQGGIDSKGYGYYSMRGVQYKAHRLACSIGMGREIAADKMACHLCSNPICVNPSHLYEGDGDTNAEDMVAAGRSLRGTRNAHNKLTVEQVHEIRSERGVTIARAVAERYGISPSSVYDIWHSRNWKWLPPSREHDEDDRDAQRRHSAH